MKPIFEPDRVNYILRLYLPSWRYDERVEELARCCQETGVKHVMLFTDAQHIAWNQLTLDDARQEADTIRQAKDRLAKEGIRVGINSTYNMPPSRWDHREHNEYDHWVTLQDGTCQYRTPCLLDPKMERYLEQFYTLLAQINPDYIHVDDDHRYVALGDRNTWGCFCDLHLATFGKLTGKVWTRDTLDRALMTSRETRCRWIEFLGQRLMELGQIIQRSVHAVNPEIEVGQMVPCVHCLPVMGHTITNVLERFRSQGINHPVVRPCIGPYPDRDRRQIIPGLFYMEFIGHLLGDEIQYTPEIETAYFTRLSKSMTVVRFHIVQCLLNRMNNPAISLCGYAGDSPYLEPAFIDLLKDEKAFFEGVRQIAPERGTRKGVQFIWHFDSPKRAEGTVKSVSDLFWPAFACHDILGNLGFPVTYDETGMKFLAGDSIRALGAARIKDLLSGACLLDAVAARALSDLGYADLIGVRVGEELTGYGAELCDSETFFGIYNRDYIPIRTGIAWRLIPNAKAVCLSRIVHNGRREIGPGVLVFTNALGGRMAVLPYTIHPEENGANYYLCYQRLEMFKKMFWWMDPAGIPLLVEQPTDFAVQAWDNGTRLTACVTNLSFDATDKITLRLAADNLSSATARFVDHNGQLCDLKKETTTTDPKGGLLWEVQYPFQAFRPLVLVVDRKGS